MRKILICFCSDAACPGYGLEDDEDKPESKSFRTTVGGFSNIAALNEAVIGMKTGGVRRFSILPQKGWEKAIKGEWHSASREGETIKKYVFNLSSLRNSL